MLQAVGVDCPACRRTNPDDALVCEMCGELLRRAPVVASRLEPPLPEPSLAEESPARDPREPWIYLGVGALTAPLFALTPLVDFMD